MNLRRLYPYGNAALRSAVDEWILPTYCEGLVENSSPKRLAVPGVLSLPGILFPDVAHLVNKVDGILGFCSKVLSESPVLGFP